MMFKKPYNFVTKVSPETRRWVYGVAVALLPVLVFYNVVKPEASPLWIALVMAFFAVSPVEKPSSTEDSEEVVVTPSRAEDEQVVVPKHADYGDLVDSAYDEYANQPSLPLD